MNKIIERIKKICNEENNEEDDISSNIILMHCETFTVLEIIIRCYEAKKYYRGIINFVKNMQFNNSKRVGNKDDQSIYI